MEAAGGRNALGGVMVRFVRRFCLALLAWICAAERVAQTALTWREIRARFEAANPTLQADQIGIDESKASEITAFPRPNPQFTATADQIHPFAQAWDNMLNVGVLSYLHERGGGAMYAPETALGDREGSLSEAMTSSAGFSAATARRLSHVRKRLGEPTYGQSCRRERYGLERSRCAVVVAARKIT
jgi:hypothetical protein